jgi:hypothetical protein
MCELPDILTLLERFRQKFHDFIEGFVAFCDGFEQFRPAVSASSKHRLVSDFLKATYTKS